jgi:hypothetical protein
MATGICSAPSDCGAGAGSMDVIRQRSQDALDEKRGRGWERRLIGGSAVRATERCRASLIYQQAPCFRLKIPCSVRRIPCSVAQGIDQKNPMNSRGCSDPWGRKNPKIAKFPCIFPVEQGIARGEWFAVDCAHRQLINHWYRRILCCAAKPELRPRFRALGRRSPRKRLPETGRVRRTSRSFRESLLRHCWWYDNARDERPALAAMLEVCG